MVDKDEYETPAYAVFPILKYLKAGSKIWCPFDREPSNFTKVLRINNFQVVCTHIKYNEDFLKIIKDCDYIISNPPYSKLSEILERLFKLNQKFAMLIPINRIFDSRERFRLFSTNSFELLIFDKRINYLNRLTDKLFHQSASPFLSVYVCHNILPQKIIFEKLDRKRKV